MTEEDTDVPEERWLSRPCDDLRLALARDLDAVAVPVAPGIGGLDHIQVHPVPAGSFELEDPHLGRDLDLGGARSLGGEGLIDVG